MRYFAGLFAVATAITGALAQYDDGYENVTTATTPVQIRLAYQGPSAMMVSWNTFSQLTNPTVMYGVTPDALNQIAVSSVSVTYATSLTYNNHVNITGLLPFTTYYYLPQNSNATTPYSFTTARPAGDPTPYTVGVVVDMGTFGALGLSTTVGSGAANPLRVNEQTTITALTNFVNNYEFLVHAGDIAYADYWLKEEIQAYLSNTTTAQGAAVYEHILNAFFDEMVGLTSQKAYMVNAGNHEANCDNGGTTNKATGVKYTESICAVGQTNFTGYVNHWRMPSGPSGGLGNFWYSYDYGMTHFVHIDTETDLGNGLVGPDEGSPEYGGPFGTYNQQINWLTNDLASVNRTVTPWIVVFGHRGWYLSASSSVCANCQTAFETILHTYDVDIYINGHAHLYERTQPIYNGVIDPNGLNNPSSTLYVTNGAAGHYDGLDTFTTIQSYSAYHEASDYAWSTLTFTNSTSMTISTLWSANNSVFDSATLYKAHVYSTNPSSTITSSSSSTATTSATSASTTNPSTTTNTATTTSTAVYPSYTNFNGQGHLFVYTGGLLEGDIGSAGTWYNAANQNTATYTAVPLYSNNTAFYLEHSGVYCAIGSDSSFGCAATASSGATVFGQTADGNLTYNGSPAFYASSAASGSSRPTVYATSLPVSLNIVWGGTAASAASTTSTTSTSSSATSTTVTPTSSSATTASSTSSSATTASSTSSSATTASSTSSSATTASSTSSSATSSTASSTTTTTSSSSSSSSASALTVTSTATVTQSASITTLPASTITATQTATSSTTSTQTTTTTEIDPTTVTQISSTTETDTITTPTTVSNTITQTSSTTETDTVTTPTTVSNTITQTSSTTETDTETDTVTTPTTILNTVTQTSSTTETDTLTTPTTIYNTNTQTATETDSTTITQSATVTETDSTTLPASTVTESDTTTTTQPASTVTFTQPASTVTETQPASTVTETQPASTVTTTQPASTVTVTQPASTFTVTQPASTVTVTQPASTVTTTKPASTVTHTSVPPASTVTITKSASTVTKTTTATVKTTATATTTLKTKTNTVTVTNTKTVTTTSK